MLNLSDWVGRSMTETERFDARLIRWLAAALERETMAHPRPGDPVPAGWHWTLFAPVASQSGLGRDGHPQRGSFLPPVEQPRRMFAGARLQWHAPLRVDASITRESTIRSCERKSGRTGEMVFVTVAQRYSSEGVLLLEEEQDLVYRFDPGPDELRALAQLAERARAGGLHAFERAGVHQRSLSVDPVVLFRYSAATFNGHRIHYDRDYATAVEGYPGLVVHGPLIATLLLDHLEQVVAPGAHIEGFSFRAKRPTFDIAAFALHADRPDPQGTVSLWSTNNVGEVALDAQARIASPAQ
jgi:3-methylfumaryl-CoA hydratase